MHIVNKLSYTPRRPRVRRRALTLTATQRRDGRGVIGQSLLPTLLTSRCVSLLVTSSSVPYVLSHPVGRALGVCLRSHERPSVTGRTSH